VGAIALPCNSHYFITRGEVDWDRKLTPTQTVRARDADRRSVEEHRAATRSSWIKSLWRRFFG
jgi:hypothetical protein